MNNINACRAIVVLYTGTELSQIGEKMVADYLFDNASARNISIHRLDYEDIARTVAEKALRVRMKAMSNESEDPLANALTYIGEKFDTSSGLPTFIIQLMTAANNGDENLKKALSIIYTYDDKTKRESYPQYRKYHILDSHVSAIKNLHMHFNH